MVQKKKKIQGEAKILKPETVLQNPDIFKALMDFQYGTGETYQKAEEYLFSDLPEKKTATLEEERWLFVDNSENSKRAIIYFQQQKIPITVVESNEEKVLRDLKHTSPWFANSFNEPLLPTLIFESPQYGPAISYPSFSGVKAYLRGKMYENLPQGKMYWKEVKTFFPEREYDSQKGFGKKKNLVACFNEEKEVIFEGGLEKAPFSFQQFLEEHDFKEWYKVSCWKIGNLVELSNKKNAHGVLVDPETSTIIFPDEEENLKEGRKIIVQDSRSIYHVTYEAYFNHQNIIFGIFADMVD